MLLRKAVVLHGGTWADDEEDAKPDKAKGIRVTGSEEASGNTVKRTTKTVYGIVK